MAQTLYKTVDYTLSKLLADIDIGEIGLPDIQRPFVWSKAKVRDLFDSMYKGFPVGYFLFWSNKGMASTKGIGTNAKQKIPDLLIVDGQQRLTSLYAVLKGVPVLTEDFTAEHIRIAFRPRDQVFEVADAATVKDPEFIPDIAQLWSGSITGTKFIRHFIANLRKSRTVTDDEEDILSESIDKLKDIQNYPFTALELSSNVDEEQVAEVFVRINSQGKTLNQADFILTLMSVFWEEGRRDLEQFCREARQPSNGPASSFNYFLRPDPDHLLRVIIGYGFRRARLKYGYQLLRGKDLETGLLSAERREKQFAMIQEAQRTVLDLTDWHEFLKALMRAGYRSNQTISSEMAILYSYTLFLIGRHQYQVDHAALRDCIARWFFMSHLTQRYSGVAESRMEQDLALLDGCQNASDFIARLDAQTHAIFTDDYWQVTLPNEMDSAAARSPIQFSYVAALNILNAQVLFSPMKIAELLDPATKAKKSPLERHHLFPKAYLATLDVSRRRDVNQIANYALIEWADNIDISDESPSVYWPTMVQAMKNGGLSVIDHMRWHALPDGWETMEYADFLSARRRLMASVIRNGFIHLQRAIKTP